MKNAFAPLVALLALLIAPYISRQEPTELTRYYWLSVFTYTPSQEIFTDGVHTYQYEFHYSVPKPGSLVGQERQVDVASRMSIAPGFALLRPGGLQILDRSETDGCSETTRISPDQPVKFIVAWVPDQRMSREEIDAQIQSMIVTVRWDDHPPVAMTFEATSASWEPLWNCQPWAGELPKTEPAGSF